jgi:hypothetical protein
MRILALLILITPLSGCTTREAYEFVRDNGRSHCDRLPDTERERCLVRTADNFDTFERQRAMAQEPPCPDFPEKVREVCVSRAVEDLEDVERQRADAKQNPYR